MAVVNGVVYDVRRGVYHTVWSSLANGDIGSYLTEANHPDKTVQVSGTFGAGGTLILQGSNDGGSNWFPLTDPQGNNISFTAAGGKVIVENPGIIRPNVTGGDGTTALTVDIYSV